MGQRRTANQSAPAANSQVSEQQLRLIHAEIADSSGGLPELDLHGKTANTASVEVYDYIMSMNAAGEPCCRIVHGKGLGVLREVVMKEISELTEQNVIATHFQSRKYPGAAIVIVFPV